MKSQVSACFALLLSAAMASAQKPPVRPPAKDDTVALEEAIRAVDRAKEGTTPAKKPATTPAQDAPHPAKPAPPAKPAKPAGTTPAPTPAAQDPSATKPTKPKPGTAATQTQITGLEDAELDNARNIIIFRKNVVVDRPDLKIWCDRLEIALNRGPAKPAAAGSEKKEDAPDAFGAETIKSATATAASGGLVVIWRKTETGDVVAVGRQAVYTATDGAFTITGLPEVLSNMSNHLSGPSEADKMILFKNGNARGWKKSQLDLNAVRAKEIRQRLFSHVPGRRPAEASAPGDAAPAAPAPAPAAGETTPPPTLPAPPPKSASGN